MNYVRLKKFLHLPQIICLFLGLLCVILISAIQYAGFLQSLELRAFDNFLIHRAANTQTDNHVVIIGETETDIRRYGYPLSDQVFTDAIEILERAGTRVIGIDKYRDIPAPPGTENLKATLEKYQNVVWIFFAGNSKEEFITAPHAIAKNPERIGFNDMVEDPDGVMRRGLLFLDFEGTSYYAFPLLLTLHYLAAENINAQSDEKGYLNLNGVSLPPLDSRFGAYRTVDTNGYQIMLDYPALPKPFPFFTLSDLLDGKVSAEALKDKVVLIGGMAPSLSDYKLFPNQMRRYGVELHAYITRQLLNIGIQKIPPLHSWTETSEYAWLIFWTLMGAFTRLRRDSILLLILAIFTEIFLLLASNYALLLHGVWVPLIAPLFGFSAGLMSSLLYFFTQSRLKRQQLMQLFSSHVSPEIAKRLWEARDQFFSEGGVRPNTLMATVLFTDLTNFTTVAEDMSPLTLMRWLNQYMEEMSHLVISHNGMVNKYIGDALMALFGVPVKRETEQEIAQDALHAVECALDFNRRLLELNQQWSSQGLPVVTMRVGIHTGTLVAGSFGGTLRMEYTVIGDTVNIASRLESFDKTIVTPTPQNPCRILIGETTYNHVKDFFEIQLVGECQLKGKNKRLKIYNVLRQLSD